jgi:pimeloyl-ACP methyl ester carboxylesterase
MHVTRSGPQTGEPIVFLHGAMVAGWMWTQQAEDLAEYRCLLPDLPGFDHSGGERWTSLASTADRVADLIRAEAPEGRAAVVGLSLGGLVGLHLAARHPSAVSSLLVSGVPLGSIPGPLRVANRGLAWLYGRRWGAGLAARAFGMPDEESRLAFVDGAGRSDPQALRRIDAELQAGPLPALAGLRVPVLAVVGSRDSAPARRFVRELPSVLPDATVRVVAGVGHQWNAEQPLLFSDLVRAWLTGGALPEGVHPPDSEQAGS